MRGNDCLEPRSNVDSHAGTASFHGSSSCRKSWKTVRAIKEEMVAVPRDNQSVSTDCYLINNVSQRFFNAPGMTNYHRETFPSDLRE